MPFLALARRWPRPGRKRRRCQGLPLGTELLSLDRLVPKQHSSGGKNKLGSIRKQGDRYLRSL
jgi:transposase